LAYAEFLTTDYHDAIRHLNTLFTLETDPIILGRALLLKGICHRKQNQVLQSIKLIEDSVRILKTTNSSSYVCLSLSELLYTLVLCEGDSINLDKYNHQINELIELINTLEHDDVNKYRSYAKLGRIYYNVKNLNKSKYFFFSALINIPIDRNFSDFINILNMSLDTFDDLGELEYLYMNVLTTYNERAYKYSALYGNRYTKALLSLNDRIIEQNPTVAHEIIRDVLKYKK
jgi:tetratricopeptide (TPR) repeat protein